MNANEWSKRKGLNLYFIAINGDNMKTDYAENIANFEIDIKEDKHIVFVTANMAARSFSVPNLEIQSLLSLLNLLLRMYV